MSIKVVVFRTDATKYETFMLRKVGGSCLKSLQGLVQGSICILPHPNASDAPWCAYANEDGLALELPSNFLAWGVLRHLGFDGRATLIPGAHLGNIVLCKGGGKNKSLAERDLAAIETAYQAYRKEMGDDEHSDDDEPVSVTKKRPAPDTKEEGGQPPEKKTRHT